MTTLFPTLIHERMTILNGIRCDKLHQNSLSRAFSCASLLINSPLRCSFEGFMTQLTEATRRAITARDPFFFFIIIIIISILAASQTMMRKGKKNYGGDKKNWKHFIQHIRILLQYNLWPIGGDITLQRERRPTQQKISLQAQQVWPSCPALYKNKPTHQYS